MSAYELAQLNVALMKEPLESPGMADFVANLDRINALAETSPGFVWRLQTEEGDATALRPVGQDILVNVSVWRDIESLKNYVYGSAHVELIRRRREWFERMSESYLVLWWVPKGHRPSAAEAIARLELLRSKGPAEDAFTFGRAFLPPDATAVSETSMPMHEKINYVEFPARDLMATKAFFQTAFDWSFVDYGPTYAAFSGQGLDGGFYQSDLSASTERGSALIVFYSERLEETEAKLKNAGGRITKPIFAFPGGRRFHFTEPSGNEFAVWSDAGA